jgi:ankyrin repeat protein
MGAAAAFVLNTKYDHDINFLAKINDAHEIEGELRWYPYRVNERDRDVTAADIHATPLIWACALGHTESVRILLKSARLNMTAKTKNGSTALHVACGNGHTEIVEMLIPRLWRRTINRLNKDGWNALHLATHHQYVEIVRLLLVKGEC